MNQEQFTGQVRSWLIGLAGVILGWFASKGYISEGTTSAVINSPVVLALTTMAAGAAWSWWNKTPTNIVAAANSLPEVAGVIMHPTPEGKAIANAAPVTVVVAGTTAAKEVAKEKTNG